MSRAITALLLLLCIPMGAAWGQSSAAPDASTFNQSSSNVAVIGGYFSNTPSNLASGQAGGVQMTIDRNFYINVNKWAGVAVHSLNQDGSGNIGINVLNTTTQATQAITAAQCASVTLGGAGSVVVTVPSISGTITAGTINFTWASDGITFFSVPLFPTPPATGGVGVTSVTGSTIVAGNAWENNLAAGGTFQACGSGITGGTINIVVNASAASLNQLGFQFDNAGNLKTTSSNFQPQATSAFATTFSFINASGAAASIKASSGNLFGLVLTNNTAAVCFAEFFNKATAPTLGTDAVVMAYEIPASAAYNIPPGPYALGNFTTGIGFGAVTAENGAVTCSVTGQIYTK